MLVSVTVVGVVGVVGGGVGRGERGRERFGVLVTERRCRFIPGVIVVGAAAVGLVVGSEAVVEVDGGTSVYHVYHVTKKETP